MSTGTSRTARVRYTGMWESHAGTVDLGPRLADREGVPLRLTTMVSTDGDMDCHEDV